MNRLFKVALLAGVAAVVLSSTDLMAQAGGGGGGGRGGRGNRGNRANFDPAQRQQDMMNRYKDLLGVTDDSEWKVISAQIEKVMTARREIGGMGGFGMMGRGGRGGRGGNNEDPNANTNSPNPRNNRPQPAILPEQEALQLALQNNASTDEIKAKLAALQQARKAKRAALLQAQADLRKLLSVKQEATAYLAGLLAE